MANSHKISWMISILTNCSHVAVVGQYKSVIHNRVSSVTRFPCLKNDITTEYHSSWINRDFLCWLTLKNTFQTEHIPKRDIPFWSHYEKGTFQKGHVPKRTHSKKNKVLKKHIPFWSHYNLITFLNWHIRITTYSKKGTFHFDHIPKKSHSNRARSKKSTFKKGHIQKRAHSKKGMFQKEHIRKRAKS